MLFKFIVQQTAPAHSLSARNIRYDHLLPSSCGCTQLWVTAGVIAFDRILLFLNINLRTDLRTGWSRQRWVCWFLYTRMKLFTVEVGGLANRLLLWISNRLTSQLLIKSGISIGCPRFVDRTSTCIIGSRRHVTMKGIIILTFTRPTSLSLFKSGIKCLRFTDITRYGLRADAAIDNGSVRHATTKRIIILKLPCLASLSFFISSLKCHGFVDSTRFSLQRTVALVNVIFGGHATMVATRISHWSARRRAGRLLLDRARSHRGRRVASIEILIQWFIDVVGPPRSSPE